MGFCRRCGDIVTGPRCKCGGTPVDAILQWSQGGEKKLVTDRWSQTYVARQSQTQLPERGPTPSSSIAQASYRFPKPISTRVSAHIASATASRPTSPLKYSSTLDDEAVEADILPAPGGSSELAKVYGSVLQSKDSLDSYHCQSCLTRFPPDATLYPDPSDKLGARFFCRNCFIQNGGSRGECVQCCRPVLILKSEGGFVENGGQVWHKRCFLCSGCGKSIGDNPMVDLLGKPSCPACFETCLIRGDESPRSRRISASDRTPTRRDTNSLGGSRQDSCDSRQSSPALEELEQRLGIRSRESTPTKEVISPRPRFPTPKTPGSPESGGGQVQPIDASNDIRRRSLVNKEDELNAAASSVRSSENGSSMRRSRTPRTSLIGASTPSPKPTQDAIEEMKRRFLHQGSPSPSDNSPSHSANSKPLYETPAPGLVTVAEDVPSYSISSRRSLDASSVSFHSPRSSANILSKKSSSSSIRELTEVFASLPPLVSTTPPMPSTPDLMSDTSDNTLSSAPSSPPDTIFERSCSTKLPVTQDDDVFGSGPPSIQLITRETPSTRLSLTPALDATCAKCTLPLFNLGSTGRYVTVPELSISGSSSRMYHSDCFRCRICDGVFEERERGQAVFVRGVQGACHLECAPTEKMTVRSVTNTVYTPPILAEPTTSKIPKIEPRKQFTPLINSQSSRYTAPLRSAPATKGTFARFGASMSCPGCQQSVSPMERGVVPGPQSTRWHSSCLICGGQDARGRRGRRKDGRPGCGKQLDSSAKYDAEEKGVWCRECHLLIPASPGSPQTSPALSAPSKGVATGNSTTAATTIFPKLTAQTTGTTMARQFTGLSSGPDGTLVRQMTGGGLSPTRQLSSSPTRQLTNSPTKGLHRQHTGGGSTVRPRPRSVIGTKDEGRGMFLVRQMTGGAL